MTVWVIVIWLVVFVILLAAFRLYPRKPKTDYKAIARETIANEQPEFQISHIFLRAGQAAEDANKIHGIAIDKNAEKFCLIEEGKPQVLEFKSLIECELMVQGKEKEGSKVSRLVKFAGTPIGDQILEAYDRFGEPKPEPFKIFGIPFPKPKQPISRILFKEKKVENKNVDLRLIINDVGGPFRTFALVEQSEPDEEQFSIAKKEGDVWFQLMKKIAAKADEEVVEPDVKALCIADELTKLMQLKQDGVLTEDEFIKVKNRLVGIEAV